MPAVNEDRDSLTAAISAEQPCGPDLEEQEDDAYIGLVSTLEVILPIDYMVADHEGEMLPFYSHVDFKDVDLPKWIFTAQSLCLRTHDLRILSILARLHILNRSASAFEAVVDVMASLLETAWDDVHPHSESGSNESKSAAIERLDEPLIVAALHHASLFSSKRYGTVTLQSYKAAVRKLSTNRDVNDTSAVDRVLFNECIASPDLVVPIRGVTDKLAQALTRISTAFLQHSPGEEPKLSRIGDAVAQLQSLFERIQPSAPPLTIDGVTAGEVAPSGNERPEVQTSENARGGVKTSRQANAALDAAVGYLSDAEPSTPALLLLRQAQALVGKPFLDAMRTLFPEQVRHAGITVAAPSIFRLPLTQLAENGHPPSEDGADDASAEEPPTFAPRSRADALLLLDEVRSYYQAAEPSSPIPMLLDRARPLLGQDFMALVRSVLPARVLSDE